MKLDRPVHQKLAQRSLLTTLGMLILLGGAAWLSHLYRWQIDLSSNASNTLHRNSIEVLNKLPDTITIQAFVSDATLQQQVRILAARYQQHKPNITLAFLNPQASPELSRRYNIGNQGAIVIQYQQRHAKLTTVSESALSNLLQQLAGRQGLRLTFLTGHGEPSPEGQANFDLGLFAEALQQRGLSPHSINLAQMPAIPDNSTVLVLANPAVALLETELDILRDYIHKGGNLLLLSEPDNEHLQGLMQQLNISQFAGILVDSQSGLYGIKDPSFIVGTNYTPHPLSHDFTRTTLFPGSAALGFDADESDFSITALLSSSPASWSETGLIAGKIRFDADSEEHQGPLSYLLTLQRPLSGKQEQRIVVSGDADFLSNAYLNNGGNLELGLRIVNWLAENDRFINIPATPAPGKTLQLTKWTIAMIGFGFLLVLPAVFLLTGLIIRRRRNLQ